MKLSFDHQIPFIADFFSEHFELNPLQCENIIPTNLSDTDILITRSVTKLNQALLNNTPIKIIASPTAGVDHMDINYCQQHNIQYFNAAGSNAKAVAQYVLSCIAYCQTHLKLFSTKMNTVGIIGVGHVGTRVSELCHALGFEVLHCDPFRAAIDKNFQHTQLNTLLIKSDCISLHTPLTYDGLHPTYHLINNNNISRLKPGSLIINSARGAVLANNAIVNTQKNYAFCLDVFEHEPNICAASAAAAIIATPHIAGHSRQARWQGVQQISAAIHNALALATPQTPAKPTCHSNQPASNTANSWQALLLHYYDPSRDAIKDAGLFGQQRNAYRPRDEWPDDFLQKSLARFM